MDNLSTDLKIRDGLPEALRHLVRAFPRGTWEAHPHFGGLVAFWLDRHMMFRRLSETLHGDAQAVIDRAMDPRQYKARLSRLGGTLLNQLHGHHQIEDVHYFPVLQTREASVARGFEILDRDHHAMDGLLSRFADAANAVLQDKAEPGSFHGELLAFDALLLRHLEDEEDLVVPVILKHGPEGLG